VVVVIRFSDTTLTLDIETHSADEMYSLPPREFFRLGGLAWGEAEPIVTEDYDEVIEAIRSATMVISHNGHSFDWSVLFGPDSIEPVHLARQRKLFCTYTHAQLANPAPEGYYQGRGGKRYPSTKPEEYRKWYSLDNQAFQLGVDGKSADVSELADRYLYTRAPKISEKTGKELKTIIKTRIPEACCGYGDIPLDLEEFREYLQQDVRANREVARKLLEKMPFTPYAQREQLKKAIACQISRNGWRVDQALVLQRIIDMAEEAAHALDGLHGRYGFPVNKKKPTATTEGKQAILKAFKELGAKEADFLRTDKGALSYSADSVHQVAARVSERSPELADQAARLGDAVGMLAGQRSLAELTEKSVHPDGKVHPSIDPLQRSGRFSTTKPGLTIWDDFHKDYYIADQEDHRIVEFDFSNADARAVAAMSGDLRFAERFEPGADGHLINAQAAWGIEKVGTDRSDPVTAAYRQAAKAPGHGWSYRLGPGRAARIMGVSFLDAKAFLDGLNRAFRGVVAWQDRVCDAGKRDGYVVNDWGRVMQITGSDYTQPPALLGQSTTNEVLFDGLIKLPDRILRMIKLTVHDAVVASIPLSTLDKDIDLVVRCFSRTWKPRNGGQPIEFPLGHGPAGRNWKEAVH
jgi:DNA polymerase-1